MKFIIQTKNSPTEYNGSAIVYSTGKPPFIHISNELFKSELLPGKTVYKTGLQKQDIINNRHIPEADKELYLNKQKDLVAIIHKYYGEDVVSNDNRLFWDGARSTLKITTENINTIYDTEQADDAILYLSILAGSYPSVAPTKEIAETYSGYNCYLSTQEEASEKESDDKYGNKITAYSELVDLLQEAGNDALVYISYLMSDLGKGYTKNTSRSVIKTDMIEYIENGINGKDKKKAINKFIKLAQLWKKDRETLIGKAMISAAAHYGKLRKNKDKKLEYKSLVLGPNVTTAYDILNKPANTEEFDNLMDEVELILNK